ncbi:MAG: hypothetical protein LBS51_04135 [Oscillospiraceae bacterium]|jgi:hypothetical protein|nr:hypothetical protein [Oscillospiraceae bacterium]
MKRLLAIMAASVYLVPLSIAAAVYVLRKNEARAIFAGNLEQGWPLIIPFAFAAFSGALAVANIIAAARGRFVSLSAAMVAKLCLAPFYIINFCVWALGLVVFHTALIVLPLLPFLVMYAYLTVLGTSAHVISNLRPLRRRGIITTGEFALHFVLQVVFVLDVLDSIYLNVVCKRRAETMAVQENPREGV